MNHCESGETESSQGEKKKKKGCWNAQSNQVQIKAVTAKQTEDSNSGTGFLISSSSGLGLLNIPFFDSSEPLVTALKNHKTEKNILVSFSKCISICEELSHMKDGFFFFQVYF